MKLMLPLLIGIGSVSAYAQIDKIGWSKDVSMKLGRGVTKSFPLNKHFSCFNEAGSVYQSTDRVGLSGSVASEMKIAIVNDKKTLDQVIGISGQLSAHTTFSKLLEKLGTPAVSLGFGAGKKDSMDESTLALVINVESDFGRYELSQKNGQELKLRTVFQDMLDEGRYNEFMQKCGTHYIAQENRGGRITAVIKISQLSKDKKKQLALSLSFKKTLNPYQGSSNQQQNQDNSYYDPNGDQQNPNNDPNNPYIFRMPYDQAIKQPGLSLGLDNFLTAAKEANGTIEISLIARGGGGMAEQTLLFDNATTDNLLTVNGLLQTIGQYLKSYRLGPNSEPSNPEDPDSNDTSNVDATEASDSSYKNVLPGAAVDYYLASYDLYGLPKAKAREVVNNDLLVEVYYLYVAALGSLELVTKQLELIDPNIESAAFNQLSTAKAQYQKYVEKLWDIARDILDNDLNNDPSYETLPALPALKVEDLFLSLTFNKTSLECVSSKTKSKTGSLTPINCGTKASSWSASGAPLWRSQFVVEGKVGSPHLLESMVVRELDSVSGSVVEQLLILVPGDNLSYGSIDKNGNFKLNFKELEQIRGYDEYVKARKNLVKFEIMLKGTDGTEKVYPLKSFNLTGAHIKHEKLIDPVDKKKKPTSKIVPDTKIRPGI